MKPSRHPADLSALLQAAGLRPTRQRKTLAGILFDGCPKHLTAEQVHAVARKKTRVSLATVYNALHQFTKAGLLREVLVDSNRVYFDTNTEPHHHFYDPAGNTLHDIPARDIKIAQLPEPPAGHTLASVDIVIRLS